MSGLEQLDRLRREAVERARVAALAARDAVRQAERALQAALQHELAAERQVARARAGFATATSVLDLRAAELQLTDARAVRTAKRAASLRCERACAEARAAVADCERTLVEAELGRRAVEQRLSQRALDVGRRTERRREDEADDAFRTARARRTLA